MVKNRTPWNGLTAGSVVATLRMIVAFPLFRHRFSQGIALSGLKG
ncbi:hypothetical protein [Micromonospora musae]|nr:hypothetical protein [Micromonospora musae]